MSLQSFICVYSCPPSLAFLPELHVLSWGSATALDPQRSTGPTVNLALRDQGYILLMRIILKPPPTPILGKIIFHKTGLWCQKCWGLLS